MNKILENDNILNEIIYSGHFGIFYSWYRTNEHFKSFNHFSTPNSNSPSFLNSEDRVNHKGRGVVTCIKVLSPKTVSLTVRFTESPISNHSHFKSHSLACSLVHSLSMLIAYKGTSTSVLYSIRS